MKRIIRMTVASLVYSLGFVLAAYVGGYMMLLQPIRHVIQAYTLGSLTAGSVALTVIKIVTSSTVAGAIWCLMYMISNFIYDKRDE